MIKNDEIERYHAAAKLIEIDGCQGYFTCKQRFGGTIAGMALVAWLRGQKLDPLGWPRDELVEEVNKILREEGRLEPEKI